MEKATTCEIEQRSSLDSPEANVVAVPGVHAKTIILVLVSVLPLLLKNTLWLRRDTDRAPVPSQSVCFIYFAQLMNLVGSGAFSRDIAAVVGGSAKSSWIGNTVPILAVVLSPPISQAADLWGRKWFLVGLTAAGCVGSIIISRATSMNMAIAGAVVAGLSYGAQPLVIAIPSEVLPRRHRPYAQASTNIAASFGAVNGLLVGGALTRNGHPEGFRVYWYIVAGLYLASAIGCALLYNPPLRELQVALTQKEKLRNLDWTGYAFLATGLILFCVGLIWSQNPYPWTDAHVLVTFLLGIAISAGLIVYETRFKKDGMFHHMLFNRGRNFALALGCIFVEGVVFFTCTGYYPFQVSVLYTSDPLLSGLRFSVLFLVGCVSTIIAGWYCSKKKSLRLPIVASFVCFIVFNALMATTTPGSDTEVWGYICIFGFSLGVCLNGLVTVAQFGTPPAMIAVATGLVIGIRSLGGAIGLAIYNAIFTPTLSHGLAQKVPAAVLPLGLPPSSLGPFMAGLLANNATALSGVPGISESIIAAGGHAVLEAYSVGFRYVWIAAGCFSVVGLIGMSSFLRIHTSRVKFQRLTRLGSYRCLFHY
jgi:MFS family permease